LRNKIRKRFKKTIKKIRTMIGLKKNKWNRMSRDKIERKFFLKKEQLKKWRLILEKKKKWNKMLTKKIERKKTKEEKEKNNNQEN
jgi:hypothetical protein